MARKNRRRHGKPDPLQVQLSVRLKLHPSATLHPSVIQEAIDYKIETGEDPIGMEVRIVKWRNPARLTAEKRRWQVDTQEEMWRSLGNALRGADVEIKAPRKTKSGKMGNKTVRDRQSDRKRGPYHARSR